MASCNWNIDNFEGMDLKFMQEEYGDDIPIKDRLADTFHFLNGVTPHYVREQLVNGFSKIRQYLKSKDDAETPLPLSSK